MPISPDFSFDLAERQFIDEASGRHVPRRKVRDTLDDVLDTVQEDIDEASAKLIIASEEEEKDDGSVVIWVAAMATAIRHSSIISAMIGAGGRKSVNEDATKTASDRIREQLGYLTGFIDEIHNGLVLDETFKARARMYGLSGTQVYEHVLRLGDIAAGFTEERRVIGSTHPCEDCTAYSGLGWQPIGYLPMIGQDCACNTNCRCYFERRLRK